MDEKKKKLKKMAIWTIAIFATIFAVTFAVLWLLVYPQSHSAITTIGKIFASAWPIILIDVLLCAGVYFGYKFYLGRK